MQVKLQYFCIDKITAIMQILYRNFNMNKNRQKNKKNVKQETNNNSKLKISFATFDLTDQKKLADNASSRKGAGFERKQIARGRKGEQKKSAWREKRESGSDTGADGGAELVGIFCASSL